ncbi:hypothetical protein SAMN05421788_103200 [Filimonas lacunae]|uniref:Uncharacterized protein n=1 Tax=Filimonas lacunae TaxID=477680 RepID=A0A173MJP6_9BACT|nr:hypothetical protein [Filimonas lacunae]BAV07855.1 hypothetical protein FLA_3886 [Filimonas lacunae]SIT05671.1 hypothetical protein SAMN05421788_103200 [Filimonas lacunae]
MSDTNSFVVTLPLKRLRSYNIVADLMLLFSVIEFILIIYHYQQLYVAAIYGLLVAGIIGYRLYLQSQVKKSPHYFIRYAFFIAAPGWLLPNTGNVFVALLYIAAGLLEKKAKTPQTVTFSPDAIIFGGLPEKKIAWNLLSNVVLKDTLLTLDYKNNKLLQTEVITEVNEAVFNAFCARQLEKA